MLGQSSRGCGRLRAGLATWLPLSVLICGAAIGTRAVAQTVWTGPEIEFVRPSGADPTDPASQDLLVPGVAITRGETGGVYNAALEDFFDALVSPADTEWAFLANNPGQPIEAVNFAQLSFAPWAEAHGLSGSGQLDLLLPGMPAVVHLISADVYLDLSFTSWARGAQAGGVGGGGFSYLRSTPGARPDSDGDGVPDEVDVCPDFADDQADTNMDGRGDACECGDQNGDGILNIGDILAINAAIFDTALVTPLCDANDDDQCNVGDILAVNAKIFGAETFCARFPRPL